MAKPEKWISQEPFVTDEEIMRVFDELEPEIISKCASIQEAGTHVMGELEKMGPDTVIIINGLIEENVTTEGLKELLTAGGLKKQIDYYLQRISPEKYLEWVKNTSKLVLRSSGTEEKKVMKDSLTFEMYADNPMFSQPIPSWSLKTA
ncbi:MAG: hypothetical protein AAB537_03195 [Patescibacteria group bacterium]